jgi:O-antigen ligase/tetratricopeptide (TPR) repeat protein
MERKVLIVLLALTLLAVVFIVEPNSRSSILIKEFAAVTGSLVCFLVLAAGIQGGRISEVPAKGLLPIALVGLAIAAWSVLTHFLGVRSVNGPGSIFALISLAGLSVSIPMLLRTEDRDCVIWVFLGSCFLLFVYALLQWRGVSVMPWDETLAKSGRVSGSLGNPNLLGSFAAASVPLGLGFLLGARIRGPFKALLMLLICALAVIAIVASGTRGSLIGLFGGSLVLIWGLFRRRGSGRKAIPILLISLCVLGLGLYLMRARLAELGRGSEGTVQVRKLIWSGTVNMFADRPLTGWGPGSFQIVFPSYRNPSYHILGVSHNTLHAHCEYLEILSDTGVIGAFLWLAAAWVVWKALRGGRDWPVRRIALLAALAAVLLEGTVSVALRWPPTQFMAALLVGLLLVDDERPVRSVPRWAGAVLLLPVAVLGALAVPHYMDGMRSGRLLFRGKDVHLVHTKPEMSSAETAASRALETGNREHGREALYHWQNAVGAADSAIKNCQLCVEVDSDNLGGWYALGSAYITRAITAKPSSRVMQVFLERVGIDPENDRLSDSLTIMALACYDSLRARAPDYAEVHNNIALAYTRLGRMDEAVDALLRAYSLYGHRTREYHRQMQMFGPVLNLDDARIILWLGYLHHYRRIIESGMSHKVPAIRQALANYLMFTLYRDLDNADSLAGVLAAYAADVRLDDPLLSDSSLRLWAEVTVQTAALIERLDEGDTLGLMEAADQLSSRVEPCPVALKYVTGVLKTRRGEQEGLELLLDYNSHAYYDGYSHIGHWPGNINHLREIILGARAQSFQGEWHTGFITALTSLLDIDRRLASLVTLATEDFSPSVSDSLVAFLRQTRTSIGGPTYALAQRDSLPWVEGSMLELAVSNLEAAAGERPGDANLQLLRVELYYLLLSSLCWGMPPDASAAVELLVDRMQDSRTSLTAIQGEEQSSYDVQRSLEHMQEDLYYREESAFSPFLQRVRSALIDGEELSIVIPEHI